MFASPKFRRRLAAFAALSLSVGLAGSSARAQEEPVKKDVPYVPTPQEVVDEMLKLADLKKGEKMYDLGCGDGRLVVTAAKTYGATGVGVDIDPERIKESNENAQKAGVTDKVKFIKGNLFEMDFKDANVLTLYLLPSVNMQLRPKILDLKPGTRIVSHAFDMGDWQPDVEKDVDGRTVYFWVVPAKVAGTWETKIEAPGAQGAQQATLDLKQEHQNITGTAKIGDKTIPVTGKIKGEQITLNIGGQAGQGENGQAQPAGAQAGAQGGITYSGTIKGSTIQGRKGAATATGANGNATASGGGDWTARRQGGGADEKGAQPQGNQNRAGQSQGQGAGRQQ